MHESSEDEFERPRGQELVSREFFGAVLRIGGVTVARESLEAALGCRLDRYELVRVDGLHYAQMTVPDSDELWPATLAFIERFGVAIESLIEAKMIGGVELDLGFAWYESDFVISHSIPSSVLAALGSSRIDFRVTFYPAPDSEQA